MFERFTQEAKAVLVAAQDVAIELGARHIGPGHLLYGCTEGQETSAGEPLRSCGVTGAAVRRFLPRAEELAAGEIDSDALRVIGIDYDGVRAAVEKTFGEGSLGAAPDRRAASARVRKPPFSADAKRSLALSLRVALELRDHRIRPGHLLLGLLRLDDDFVSSIVQQSGATIAGLSAAVLERVDAA